MILLIFNINHLLTILTFSNISTTVSLVKVNSINRERFKTIRTILRLFVLHQLVFKSQYSINKLITD